MTRATNINDNLINKRGTFDDSQVSAQMIYGHDNLINKRGFFGDSQVSTAEADIIVGQKCGPALAGLATTALKFGALKGKACMKITHPKHS